MRSIIETITKNGLCIGCGLCEAISHGSIEMKLGDNGFYNPSISTVNVETENIINQICPGINVINDLKFSNKERIWGKVLNSFSGFSKDTEIRKVSSSGGIISAISLHLLESKTVDAILQVGGDKDNYQKNTLHISRTREDILNCASSRYAPALVFDKIIEILNSNNYIFGFIGKPCDISGLKNFLNLYPQHSSRFRLFISIFCAGLPSFNGTKAIIKDLGAKDPVKNLSYRGNGWPGKFSFTDETQKEYAISYNDSWGKTLNKHLNFRCKICMDGIGLQADLAVGDAWETKDGYPDFTEREGRSLIVVRTKQGMDAIKEAEYNYKIEIEDLALERIRQMQPYQYSRRLLFGARILAFYIMRKSLLNFKNLRSFRNLFYAPSRRIVSEFKGTAKRLLK